MKPKDMIVDRREVNVDDLYSPKEHILFILVDPSMIYMPDMLGIKHPLCTEKNIVRYRQPQWGQDHPAIEIFTADKSTGVTTIEELKKKLGVDNEQE